MPEIIEKNGVSGFPIGLLAYGDGDVVKWVDITFDLGLFLVNFSNNTAASCEYHCRFIHID